MMRVFAALALCLSLPACVAGGNLAQETSRMLARGAVDTAAARYLPGVPVKPYSDCVINNSMTGELVQLAQIASGNDAASIAQNAWPVVQTVTSRPQTQECLLQAVTSGSSLFAGQKV